MKLHNESMINNKFPTDGRIDRAKELDRKATGGIYQLIYALKEISENELFIELGFSSMQAYCSQRLNFSATSAFNYMQITEKFGKFLSPSESKIHISNSLDNNDLQNSPRGISELSYHKLYQLSRLPEKQIENLMNESFVKINGKTITFDKIKEMSRQDLAEIISSEKKAEKLNMPKPWIERRYKIRQTALKLMKLVQKEIADAYIMGPEKEQIERPLKEIQLWLDSYFNSSNPQRTK